MSFSRGQGLSLQTRVSDSNTAATLVHRWGNGHKETGSSWGRARRRKARPGPGVASDLQETHTLSGTRWVSTRLVFKAKCGVKWARAQAALRPRTEVGRKHAHNCQISHKMEKQSNCEWNTGPAATRIQAWPDTLHLPPLPTLPSPPSPPGCRSAEALSLPVGHLAPLGHPPSLCTRAGDETLTLRLVQG